MSGRAGGDGFAPAREEKAVVPLIGFVSLVGALAWPVASFLIAVLIRRELRMAVGRLGQVKYAGMEVNFREEIRLAEDLARSAGQAEAAVAPAPAAPVAIVHESAEGDASELPGTLIGRDTTLGSTMLVAPGPRPEAKPDRDADSLRRLCLDSPRLAILEAWDDLGHAAARAVTALGDRRSGTPVRAESAARFLVDRGWLNGAQGRLVDRLRQIAARAERGEGPAATPDDARRYVDLVLPLLDRLNSIG